MLECEGRVTGHGRSVTCGSMDRHSGACPYVCRPLVPRPPAYAPDRTDELYVRPDWGLGSTWSRPVRRSGCLHGTHHEKQRPVWQRPAGRFSACRSSIQIG